MSTTAVKTKPWEIITEAGKTNGLVGGLKLAHNSGHQYALLAGLEWASTHAIRLSIDADLQDDVDAIEEMTIVSYRERILSME